jgi:hypothetical protein
MIKRPASTVLVAGYAILVAIVVHLARRGTVETRRISSDDSVMHASEAQPPAMAQSSQRENFQWRQIESADYRTYIANLRAIGCPEQTIRDIIIADVHQVYEKRRRQLEPRSSAAPMDGLRWEESNVISILLGSTMQEPAKAESSGSAPKGGRNTDETVAVPLAFKELDTNGMNLEPRQIEVLSELRQKFRDDLSGASLDPADPAYRKRWQEAQRECDDLISGLLGGQFYLDYEMQVSEPAPKP